MKTPTLIENEHAPIDTRPHPRLILLYTAAEEDGGAREVVVGPLQAPIGVLLALMESRGLHGGTLMPLHVLPSDQEEHLNHYVSHFENAYGTGPALDLNYHGPKSAKKTSKRKAHQHYTPEEVHALHAKYVAGVRSGKTVAEVAEELVGSAPSTLYHQFRKHGLPYKKADLHTAPTTQSN